MARTVHDPRVRYRPAVGVSHQTEFNVLANVYAYLIKTHDSKRAADPAQPCAGDKTSFIQRKEAGMI
jgi:hypothetical protein